VEHAAEDIAGCVQASGEDYALLAEGK